MLGNKFIQVRPEDSKVADIYKLLISAVVPRPIAFVTTLNSKGEGNLAPFSFFNGVCSNPPCISISIARKPDGSKKDSLRNIEETGEFVVNSANKWILEKVVNCGAEYAYGVNEMEKVGLTPLASEKVKPPRVLESAFQMECKLYQAVQIGNGGAGSSTLIVGEVKVFHLNQDIYKDGQVDLEAYQPMARLGGATYSSLGELVTQPIPKV